MTASDDRARVEQPAPAAVLARERLEIDVPIPTDIGRVLLDDYDERGRERDEALAVRDRALMVHAEQHAELERLRAIEQRTREMRDTDPYRAEVARYLLGEAP